MTHMTKRVRLKWDEDQSGPDYDAQMPVLYVEYRWGPTIVHGREYLPDAANLKAAWNYFDKDGFERWLRVCVGPIETFNGNDRSGYYIRIAEAEWRTAMGLTDEYMSDQNLTMEELLKGPDDWEFYANGEVYGIVVEELAHYVGLDGDGDVIDDSDKYEWEEKDSCWGFYGHKYALEAARTEFLDREDTPFMVIDEDGTEVWSSHTWHHTDCDTYQSWLAMQPPYPDETTDHVYDCSCGCAGQIAESHDETEFHAVPVQKEDER